MQQFNKLIEILETLLGPNGCPWDKEQTMQSMRSSLLEETSEVIEAIDLNSNLKMEEELGDLLFNVIFLCKLAEKEQRFTMQDVLHHICTKLIRRHPHIFGEANDLTTDEVLKQWEEIKRQEKGDAKQSIFEGIPKDLPPLAKAQKMGKKLKKANLPFPPHPEEMFKDEDSLGAALFHIARQGEEKGLSAEHALRRFLVLLEINCK